MAKRIDEDGIHYRLIDVGKETYRQDYDDDGNEDGEPYVEEYTDEDDRYEEEA